MNKFIELNIAYGDTTQIHYVNIDHILRFYPGDGYILVYLTNGVELELPGTTLHEMLNKLHVSN